LAVKASLAAAKAGEARRQTAASAFVVHETDAAILTEARERDGDWIHRSYLPKLALAGSVDTPDAMIASILQRDQIDGRALASLGDKEVVVLQHEAPDRWSAAVSPSLEIARDLRFALPAGGVWTGVDRSTSSTSFLPRALAAYRASLVR
jgi:hypothetical protein